MKVIKKLEIILVDEQCNVCETGYMRPRQQMLLSSPPKYPHKCNICGHIETYNKIYPYKDYQEIPQECEPVQKKIESPCLKCGGTMYNTGVTIETFPAQLEFKCKSCTVTTYIRET
jgi:hypothetical protein